MLERVGACLLGVGRVSATGRGRGRGKERSARRSNRVDRVLLVVMEGGTWSCARACVGAVSPRVRAEVREDNIRGRTTTAIIQSPFAGNRHWR